MIQSHQQSRVFYTTCGCSAGGQAQRYSHKLTGCRKRPCGGGLTTKHWRGATPFTRLGGGRIALHAPKKRLRLMERSEQRLPSKARHFGVRGHLGYCSRFALRIGVAHVGQLRLGVYMLAYDCRVPRWTSLRRPETCRRFWPASGKSSEARVSCVCDGEARSRLFAELSGGPRPRQLELFDLGSVANTWVEPRSNKPPLRRTLPVDETLGRMRAEEDCRSRLSPVLFDGAEVETTPLSKPP